jgi:hypothetical protein
MSCSIDNIKPSNFNGGNKVKTITVSKKFTDLEMQNKIANTFIKPNIIDTIVNDDMDVFTDDGKLLLRFRKSVFSKKHIDDFYENIIKFAMNTTANRGSATGSKKKNIYENPKIMTNIFGYFDRFPANYKKSFKNAGIKAPLEVRKCRFNAEYPEKYAKLLPLIQDVDHLYKKYAPDHYKRQMEKASQTHFKIEGTSFTTVTTNVNFRTTVHTDKGDDDEGFGNLVVIEKGRYTGGETCFPQYGLGVNVRTGDVLFMDVHEWHGNLPIKLIDKDAKRLSVVCYLRKNLWIRTKNKSRRFYEHHNKTLRKITKKQH